MKKALQLALSPCEQRLCYEHHVDVDAVRPKELNQYPPGQAPVAAHANTRRCGNRAGSKTRCFMDSR